MLEYDVVWWILHPALNIDSTVYSFTKTNNTTDGPVGKGSRWDRGSSSFNLVLLPFLTSMPVFFTPGILKNLGLKVPSVSTSLELYGSSSTPLILLVGLSSVFL